MAASGEPIDRLIEFIDRSPTPWHAARYGADLLIKAGFDEVSATGPWERAPEHGVVERGAVERGVVVRGGSLIAWSGAPGATATPIRLIAAHTDSPGLRLRPSADLERAGTRQLAVEVYGGPLVNSWLDRDLTVAGRTVVRDPGAPDGVSTRLFHHPDALLRVAQLAIHLDRDVNEGLVLDRQRHLYPIWGLHDAADGLDQHGGSVDQHGSFDDQDGGLRGFLGELVGVDPDAVLTWDAQLTDVDPPRRLGRHSELLAAPRLDNLCSCFGALMAMSTYPTEGPPVVIVLNDHEEVGSTSATGAGGAWLGQVLERLALAGGGSRASLMDALAGSMALSADMAHGTHPNYVERHEPSHHVHLGGGPVIKHNVNARYATDSRSAATFRIACEQAGVPVQDYSHRGDLPCGSTIGPLTAAALAIDTVDAGMAQLSMHSARELMACADVPMMCDAFGAWLTH